MTRLAIVCSHPIQYYAPWFRYITEHTDLELKVFYLWDFGISDTFDPGFRQNYRWDIPLLEGYAYHFAKNVSRRPGTNHFFGLRNPTVVSDIAAFQPDIILHFGYNSYAHQQILFSRVLRGIPKMLRGDSHILAQRSNRKSFVKSFLLRRIFHLYSAFLSVGKANREYYRKYGAPGEKIIHAPHAIDLERYRLTLTSNEIIKKKESLGLPTNKKVVLFVGKFEEKKNPLSLIRSFQKLNDKDTVLLFIGSGSLESEIQSSATSDPDIFVLSFQNQSEMPALYAVADLIVLPSSGNYETWGMAVHEAMACGVPALVSSHVGCGPDLVEEGVTGACFQVEDPTGLTDALQKLLSADSNLASLGRNAQKRISERYSYKQTTEGLLEAMVRFR